MERLGEYYGSNNTVWLNTPRHKISVFAFIVMMAFFLLDLMESLGFQ